MLKKYTFTDHDGRVLTAIASGIIEAIRLTRVVAPVAVKWEPVL